MHSINPSVLAVLGAIAAPALAETLQGLVVFTRHGDSMYLRIVLPDEEPAMLTDGVGTSKFYKGYDLTSLGENEMFDAGSYYRSRYVEDGASNQILGISPDKYKPSQLWTSTPDQQVSCSFSIASQPGHRSNRNRS